MHDWFAAQIRFHEHRPPEVTALLAYSTEAQALAAIDAMCLVASDFDAFAYNIEGTIVGELSRHQFPKVIAAAQAIAAEIERRWPAPKIEATPFTGPIPSVAGHYLNVGPEHMPLGLADRRAHDQRLAERGERDES